MDFSSESGVGRKFAFWDSGETGFSRSPEWVPDAETWGCHPHRQFSPFILGLGRISFHWVNKPSKSSRPPAFPKELTQTGAVPSPGVKSTAPVDWRVWGL
jgi:hypothetical protein